MPPKNIESQERILKAIEAQPGITRPELKALTGQSKDLIQIAVRNLSQTSKIHAEHCNHTHHWYAAGVLSIIKRVENAIIEADKAVHYVEIAARANLTPEQVSGPVHRLMRDGTIYRGEDVSLTNKSVCTYLHPANRPVASVMQTAAARIGMSVEEYQRISDTEYGPALSDPEFKDWANVYFNGSKATAQFMGGR